MTTVNVRPGDNFSVRIDDALGPVAAEVSDDLKSLMLRINGVIGAGYLHILRNVDVAATELPKQSGVVGVSVNPRAGIQSWAALVPRIDRATAVGLAADIGGAVAATVGNMTAEVETPDHPDFDADALRSTKFTGTIFLICHELHEVDAGQIVRAFRLRGYRAVVFDDARWDRQLSQRRPDIFLCHDARDKDRIAVPAYDALTARGVKVWFDKASLTVGDDLAGAIDAALRDCRRATIVVSPRLLENKGWARTEMNTLLARRASNGGARLVLPIWAEVTKEQVEQRSLMLSNIYALHWSDGVDAVCRGLIKGLGD